MKFNKFTKEENKAVIGMLEDITKTFQREHGFETNRMIIEKVINYDVKRYAEIYHNTLYDIKFNYPGATKMYLYTVEYNEMCNMLLAGEKHFAPELWDNIRNYCNIDMCNKKELILAYHGFIKLKILAFLHTRDALRDLYNMIANKSEFGVGAMVLRANDDAFIDIMVQILSTNDGKKLETSLYTLFEDSKLSKTYVKLLKEIFTVYKMIPTNRNKYVLIAIENYLNKEVVDIDVK